MAPAGRPLRLLRDQPAKHDPLAGLSKQERRILELIGEGLTNRQIGERMYLAEKTVKTYVSAPSNRPGPVVGDQHSLGKVLSRRPGLLR
jgi:FixJ family two-component response regulator